MKRKSLLVINVLMFGLNTAVSAAPPPKAMPVSPGQNFKGGYINVTAPNSDGWHLLQSSGLGMGFAKGGLDTDESFGAQIHMFKLSPTNTPEEFETLIKKSVEKDTELPRFSVQQASFTYSNERAYPCVKYHSLVQDNAPQGSKGPLLLEAQGLYCRHPIQRETGFAIIYSHRGEKQYAELHVEAENFIQNIQVPEK